MSKPTIRDIAAMAGVSPSSVSMILNDKNLPRFSEETIQKVYGASRALGYVSKKQNLHKNTKPTILIICPSMMNPYFATLVQSMEQEARSRGFLTIIYTTYWDKDAEREIMELSTDPRITGVIFSMIPQQPKLAEEFSKKVPIVAVGDRTFDLKIDTVDVNNYNAGHMVASHLIGLGHKHVAYISTTLNNEHSSRVKRCAGLQDEYLQSCPDGSVTVYTKGISSHKELHVIDVEHQTGYELAMECLQSSPQVTAMVAINDMVAYGVMDALIDSGKRIPEDISVCGFDNIYPSGFHRVDLTTIEHAIVERGRSSVRLMAEKLYGDSHLMNSDTITRVEYQSRLVARGSTGAARTN